MSKIKIFVDSIEPEYTVFEKLAEVSNIKSYPIKPKFLAKRPIKLNHSVNLDEIKKSVLEILQNNQPSGWLSKSGRDNSYSGLSLVYNPDLIGEDNVSQTIGSDTNDKDQFFYNQKDHLQIKKNTYFDSYGFRKISPAITGELLKFLKDFRFSPIRSRIGIVNANHYNESTVSSIGWHKDEKIYENLRINIPITTDPDCLFQMKNLEPEILEYGNIYTWNTHIPHRVFANTKKDFQRINLVLGFSPWFDYIEEENAWVSNEFFGKMNPLDMLAEGYFHPNIKGII
jgi:hypothetical protein